MLVNNVKKLERMARHPMISFTGRDFEGINQNLDDPMVVSIIAPNFIVKKVLIDHGSSANLLYLSTLRRMGILEEKFKPFRENLLSFFEEQVGIRGYIDLLTSFGTSPIIKTISIHYLVIDCETSIMHYLVTHSSTPWVLSCQPPTRI